MRIVADHDACQGMGVCESLAADYFEVEDDGKVRIAVETPAASDVGMIETVVNSCPFSALSLEG